MKRARSGVLRIGSSRSIWRRHQSHIERGEIESRAARNQPRRPRQYVGALGAANPAIAPGNLEYAEACRLARRAAYRSWRWRRAL